MPPPSPVGCWERVRWAPEILENSERARRNMADSSAGCSNLGGPSDSVAPRGFPRRPFSVDSFVFRRLPQLGVGKGVLGAKHFREFGRNPPQYGGFQCGIAKFRRSVRFRSFPWRAVVFRGVPLFLSVLSHSAAFPIFGRWEIGASGAKNIREFGRNPGKYGGFQCGIAKFRRSVAFRGVPRRPLFGR